MEIYSMEFTEKIYLVPENFKATTAYYHFICTSV